MKKNLLHIAAAVILLFVSQFSFATVPPLGAAANFVLFSTNGAVTNGGIGFLTLLTGNVGAQVGPVSGFGNVNGGMHAGDGATSSAAADLLTAYNLLAAAIPNYQHAILLGNETLVPGIYNLAAQSSLDGILTLDGQGNANAEFIIKIGGAFATTANSEVKLINNAKACNVFWKVEGKIELGTLSTMKGNLVANNAEIVFGAGVNLEGRALSTTGAITTNSTIAYTPVGCGSPVLNGPAAPDLKTTSCYAIFSGNGNVTNSGVSKITGDVGTNVTGTTGFAAIDVTGMIHTIADVSTAQAATDLGGVYTYLSNLTSEIELLYPAQFGHNLELTPHTYKLDGATVLTDSIFLNAQGNADAVFVFKIVGGALSTNVGSKIVLKNGAQAKNVYWVIEGALLIEGNSKFKGNIVVNNAAIQINSGTVLDGRAMTTSGANAVAAVTVTIPSTCIGLPTALSTSKTDMASIYTIPGSVVVTLKNASDVNNNQLTIYDAMGKMMIKQILTQEKTTIDTNFSSGIYFYQLTGKNNTVQSGKLISK